MGRLGQDPELRYTANQTPVATFSVATTEFRGRDGQRQEQTEWHRVVVWSKQAENCAKYLSKGRPVFVEGRLQTRAWDDKNGQKRYTTEIIATNVQFISAGQQSQNTQNEYQSFPPDQSMDHGQFSAVPQFPQADTQSSSSMSFGMGGADLDDIPF